MNKQWQPNRLDLVLASTIAVGFPFIAGFLLRKTGALIPMIGYYGLAWCIVKWRRGKTGYFNPIKSKLPRSFLINTGIVLLALVLAYQSKIIDVQSTLAGILFAIFIWAPANAASEQLLWIYIFEAFDLYPSSTTERMKRFGFLALGLIFFSLFVGLIHVIFWVQFLHTVNATMTTGMIFVILTSITGYIHIIVWRESNNMIFTFIPHLLLNIGPALWTGYNFLPYLWHF